MKNIFLFGAGASHGSGGLNYQVPLGGKLFDDLAKHFPSTWGRLPEDVSDKLREDFEDGMGIIWKQHSNNISVLMQNMAVFFSKIVIDHPENNLYAKLINQIKNKELLSDCALSTLNYDCLIELAIANNELSTKYSSDGKASNRSLLVWKLHGSCNFIVDGISLKRSAGYQSGAFFNGNGLKYIQLNEVSQFCYGDTALYPAMSIFMREKPNQIGKPHIEAMQGAWKDWVINAEKIFIVGVNPQLEDAHIWDALSNTQAKIYFCGNEIRFNKWQNLKNKHDKYIGSRFENSIDEIISNL